MNPWDRNEVNHVKDSQGVGEMNVVCVDGLKIVNGRITQEQVMVMTAKDAFIVLEAVKYSLCGSSLFPECIIQVNFYDRNPYSRDQLYASNFLAKSDIDGSYAQVFPGIVYIVAGQRIWGYDQLNMALSALFPRDYGKSANQMPAPGRIADFMMQERDSPLKHYTGR